MNLDYVNAILLLIFCTLGSYKRRQTKLIQVSIIHKDTTSFLKAVCCVSIILHHFSLRSSGGTMSVLFSLGGAYFSVPMFFLLSSYGICKSEDLKPTSIKSFIVHRLKKILLPFFIINIITLLVYHLCRANCDIEELSVARVNEAFVLIGQQKYDIVDYIMSVFGVNVIDAAMWFVYIIIYSYLAFLVSKTLFNIQKQTGKLTIIFIALIAILFAILYYIKVSPHIYRSLWGIALGAILFWVEKRSVNDKPRFAIMVVAFFVFFIPIAYLERNNSMIQFGILIPLCIIVFRYISFYYSIRSKSAISLLSSLSYIMYLVHVKILTLQWWYIGYQSALFSVLLSIMIALLYKMISDDLILYISSHYKKLPLSSNKKGLTC